MANFDSDRLDGRIDKLTRVSTAAGAVTVGSVVFSNVAPIVWGATGQTITASLARSEVWGALGVVVSSGTPGPGVLYNDWLAGSSGYWAWISSP